MLRYAQEDTHYLLYIFHSMRGSCRSPRSAPYCSGVPILRASHTRSRSLPRDHTLSSCGCSTAHLSPPQMRVFKALYEWRDRVAREEDTSPRSIVSSEVLVRLATEAPQTVPGIEQVAGGPGMPPILRRRVVEVASLIAAERGPPQTPHNAPAGLPPPVQHTPPNSATSSATVSLGVNAARHAFVPIGAVPAAHLAPGGGDRSTPSPVLSQDELFRVAGWTQVPQVQQQMREVRANSTATTSTPTPKVGSMFAEPARRVGLSCRSRQSEGNHRVVPRCRVACAGRPRCACRPRRARGRGHWKVHAGNLPHLEPQPQAQQGKEEKRQARTGLVRAQLARAGPSILVGTVGRANRVVVGGGVGAGGRDGSHRLYAGTRLDSKRCEAGQAPQGTWRAAAARAPRGVPATRPVRGRGGLGVHGFGPPVRDGQLAQPRWTIRQGRRGRASASRIGRQPRVARQRGAV